MDLLRDSLIGEVERAAVAQAAKAGGAAGPALCAALVVGAERLASTDSVEQAALFQRRGALTVDFAPCGSTSPPGNAWAAAAAVGDAATPARTAATPSSSTTQLALVHDASSS